MKCPRCSTSITASPDPNGLLICPGCNAKLRSRALPPPSSARPLPPASPLGYDATSTLPPGGPVVPARAPAAPDPGSETIPRMTPAVAAPAGPTMDAVMAELKTIRKQQDEILSLLRAARAVPAAPPRPPVRVPPPPTSAASYLDDDPPQPPVRSGHRKTVLLIDDDPMTRTEAQSMFERADVPIVALGDGSAALSQIARDKPDVIVMELEMEGSMSSKDIINMIKATMEWVDIPIVLYTRAHVESQKEARTEHGADDFLMKGPGSAEVLVNRVIALFRRG